MLTVLRWTDEVQEHPAEINQLAELFTGSWMGLRIPSHGMLRACSSAAATVPTEEVRELCIPLKVRGSTATPQVPVHKK
jgi:hypothetical protein